MTDSAPSIDAAFEQIPPRELANAPVSALTGVSSADAEALKQAFGIRTIRDFAENRFVQATQAVVAAADADAQALENAELLERLRQATAGLLFLSETDAPFTPFLWTMQKIGAEVLTAETLRAYQGLSANAPVESVEFKAFFARLTHEGNTDAQRYRDLERLLSQHLSDLVVWRAGEIQVDIFIIGKTPSGDFAGVATQAVET